MELQRQLVDIGDASLETFTAGDGTPVIGTAHDFVPTTDEEGLGTTAFAAITKMVSVNLRSMGGSSISEDPTLLSMAQAVRDLEAVRSALGYDRWTFAGVSAGGFLGLHYALMFPESLQALILVGTAASGRATLDPASIYHPDHPDNARMREAEGTQRWPEVVWPLISSQQAPVLEAARRSGGVSVARHRALQAEMRSYDLEPRLAEITTPTLVVHGRRDFSMPVTQGEIIGNGIPNAELVILEQSGHFAFWERPDEFDEAVRGFLQRVTT
jgi:proline iminopeptidase